MTVNRDEVDGVPLYWVDAPGPLRACLTFRVGMADEELARSGVTHLVEHLALHEVGRAVHDYNGFVEPTVTRFVTTGDPGDVARFLTLATQALSHLPLDRFETERDILRAEQLTRGGSVWRSLLVYRYGAQTYGLPAAGEPGLSALTAGDVGEWVAEWFTSGNAGLWLSGPPPAGLRLTLPDGPRRSPPEPSSALRHTPAWFTDDEVGGVAVSLIVPRSSAAAAYTDVLGQALFADLRRQGGASYSPQVSYDRRDGKWAQVSAYADAAEEHYGRVRDGMVHAIVRLATEGPSREELERSHARRRLQSQEPLAVLGYADVAVWDELCGEEVRTVAQLVAEEAAVDGEAVRCVAGVARGSALFALPPGLDIVAQVAVKAPEWSRREVDGDIFRPVSDPQRTRARLVVGREGVSLRLDGKPRTVLSSPKWPRCTSGTTEAGSSSATTASPSPSSRPCGAAVTGCRHSSTRRCRRIRPSRWVHGRMCQSLPRT